MNAKKIILPAFDRISILMLRYRIFNRLVSYLSYQQKRVTRRQIEEKLEKSALYGDGVTMGPFKGMQYPPRSSWASCRFEKIIGTYELEIHEILEKLIVDKQAYEQILVIGAAEGFFAIGLARVFPNAKLFAFEPEKQKTDVLRQMAELNGVSKRISVDGFCDPAKLSSMKISGKTLVFCDVDGYERELLNPSTIPWFSSADFIVELHDCVVPGISDEIRRRFSPTHQITEFKQTGVPIERYPILKGLTCIEIEAMIGTDRRLPQNWFYMESRSKSK
jgi:hypothetical protein